MTREFIKGLFPDISKENLDQIMTEHGKGIEASKNTVTALTTERDGLRTQLDTANGEIKKFTDLDVEGIKKAASDWETKYNTDTQNLKSELEETQYSHAVEGAVGGIKFSSSSARKAFVADLKAKKLPLQEGKLLGLADFQTEYATSDPEAFAPADGVKQPVITKGSGSNNSGGSPDAALRAAFGLPAKTE